MGREGENSAKRRGKRFGVGGLRGGVERLWVRDGGLGWVGMAFSPGRSVGGCPSNGNHAGAFRRHRLSRPKTLRRKSSRVLGSFVSHSHMTWTFQPSSWRARATLRSLCTLWRNLFFQNSVCVLGIVDFSHRLWRCQKHPCTNIATLYFLNTMSGIPGMSRR